MLEYDAAKTIARCMVRMAKAFQDALPGWWYRVSWNGDDMEIECGPDLKGVDRDLLRWSRFDEGIISTFFGLLANKSREPNCVMLELMQQHLESVYRLVDMARNTPSRLRVLDTLRLESLHLDFSRPVYQDVPVENIADSDLFSFTMDVSERHACEDLIFSLLSKRGVLGLTIGTCSVSTDATVIYMDRSTSDHDFDHDATGRVRHSETLTAAMSFVTSR